MAPGDPFGDMLNGPAKYVVSKTFEEPIWRNTTIIRDNVHPRRRPSATTSSTPYPSGVVSLDDVRDRPTA
jgi:hypothetical protein